MTHTTDSNGRIRFNYTWPLSKRLEESMKMVAAMSKEGRCPKMSIPAGSMLERGGDEDIFICDALREAKELIDKMPAPPDSAKVGEPVGHFIQKCKQCGTVMAQCRCMDCNKTVTYGLCDACKSKPPASPAEPLGACTRCGHAPPYHHGTCPYNATPAEPGTAEG